MNVGSESVRNEALAFEAALEACPSGLVALDAGGGVVSANEAAGHLLGLSLDALRGLRFDACLREAEAEDGRQLLPGEWPFERARRQQETVRAVLSFLRPDGERRLASVAVVPVRGAAGVEGWVASLEELPARLAGEALQERAEASLRELMERSPDPMVVHRDGRIVYLNRATAEMLDYDGPEELLGKPVLDFVHPGDQPIVRERIERMVTRREPVPLNEERFLRKDGTAVHVDVVALPIVFGSEMCVFVYGHDLTERRWAEAERQRLLDEQMHLRREAQHRAAELRAILDHLQSGLVVIDAGGRVTLTNRATAKLFGRDPDELPTSYAELFRLADPRRPDGRAYALNELPAARALAGEEVDGDDITVRHASGADRFLRVSASPIRDGSGRVTSVVSLLRDVTELVEFDRLKDQFLRVVAHELKTPVAIMKGYAQLLLRSNEGDGRRATLEKIDRGADRIDRIVRDMLDLSQMHLGNVSLEHRPVALDELVAGVARERVPALRRHRIDLALEPATVEADALRLGEVVRTLLDNAVRYSPEGGRILVSCASKDGRAVVSVQDEGVGIPREKQARLFQRFYRAHTDTPHDYGGLGVGLYIAREIVRRHGGQMWFTSEEGQGSTFSFSLPLGGSR